MQGHEQTTKPDALPHDHFGGTSPVWLKQQTRNIRRGQVANLEVVLRDHIGNPIDLSDCLDSGESSSVSGDGPRIVARFCEVITRGSDAMTTVAGTLLDSQAGLASVTVPTLITHAPGIYYGEVAALVDESDESIITSQAICVWVEGGLFGDAQHGNDGPPRLLDINIALRDFKEENELLGAVDFDATEVAYALGRPVMDWNEALPPIRKKYTTLNFPYRSQWTEATIGYLYAIAGEHYQRNQLAYNAGGNSIDDKNKSAYYTQLSQAKLAPWKGFVQSTKVALNVSGAWGRLDSGYSRGRRWM